MRKDKRTVQVPLRYGQNDRVMWNLHENVTPHPTPNRVNANDNDEPTHPLRLIVLELPKFSACADGNELKKVMKEAFQKWVWFLHNVSWARPHGEEELKIPENDPGLKAALAVLEFDLNSADAEASRRAEYLFGLGKF
jgi:hypothetical protein